MSIRGEITEAQKRQGDRLARENFWFDEEEPGGRAAAPARATEAPRPSAPREPTLYEVGPWMARMGLRCGPAPTEP